MESSDREASRGHLELKVTKEPEDSQEPRDPSDCRYKKDIISDFVLNIQRRFELPSCAKLLCLTKRCPLLCRGCQDHQVRRARQEMLDLW